MQKLPIFLVGLDAFNQYNKFSYLSFYLFEIHFKQGKAVMEGEVIFFKLIC